MRSLGLQHLAYIFQRDINCARNCRLEHITRSDIFIAFSKSVYVRMIYAFQRIRRLVWAFRETGRATRYSPLPFIFAFPASINSAVSTKWIDLKNAAEVNLRSMVTLLIETSHTSAFLVSRYLFFFLWKNFILEKVNSCEYLGKDVTMIKIICYMTDWVLRFVYQC